MALYHVPGVSLAVISDGKSDWVNGDGVTRAGGKLPVSESTLFQAASIVKLVTATGALRLVQLGVLNFDRDVNLQLRTWRVPSNQYTAERPVTLRDLLSHRSEEHTSELQSLMRISYAVFCLKKKKTLTTPPLHATNTNTKRHQHKTHTY